MANVVDIFPAIVRIAPPGSLEDYTTFSTTGDSPEGTRRLDRCRALVARGNLLIAVDSPEGPQLIFRELTESISGDRKLTQVLTSSGKIVAISKDNNCGCGSRLRAWNPYGAFITSSEDPT